MGLNIGITNDYLLNTPNVASAVEKYVLWAKARQGGSPGLKPSLDLDFARNKSLVDNVTGAQLVTFTRASSGTFVGSDGVIKTAVTNSELHSEAFDNAYYSRAGINAFGSGSVANAIAAPNGSLTADFITEDTTAFRHRLAPVGKAVVSGITYTYSIYAKSTNRNLFLNCDALFNARSAFNLQTGVVTVGNGSGAIEPVGDGWYRCSITGAATSTKTDAYYIQIQTGTVDQNYTGDNTSGIYLWGAQLEQSSTVGEYIPTTSTINSAPRFDHNPTTGESLGLLVEEQRTNLALQSESFTTSPWTLASGFVSATGGLLTESTSGASSQASFNQTLSVTSGVAYTGWLDVQYVDNRFVQIVLGAAGFGAEAYANYDLVDGVVGTKGTTTTTSSITRIGTNRYRIVITASATNTDSTVFQFAHIASASAGRASNVTLSGLKTQLLRAQLEAGAFPTSYIPTTTATVTRSADVCSISGSNFSSWYNASEGTIFCDHLEARPNTGVIYGFANTFDNSFYVVPGATNNVLSFTAGNNQASLNLNITGAGPFRHASAYQLNNFGASLNGGSISSDTVALVPSGPVRFAFGTAPWSLGTAQLNSRIRRLTYWPTRLPNSTLQAVTQ